MKIQVNKKNLIESSFNCSLLLIYILVIIPIYKVLHAPFHLTLPCVQSLETKEKEKKKNNKNKREKKRKIKEK